LPGSLLSHNLDHDFTLAGTIVEIDEDHLLPRPERQAPTDERNAE
jgi:hypothetical protein